MKKLYLKNLFYLSQAQMNKGKPYYENKGYPHYECHLSN